MTQNETIKETEKPFNIEEFINGLNDEQKTVFLNNLKITLKANNLKLGSNSKRFYVTDLAEKEKQRVYYFSNLDNKTQELINGSFEETRVIQINEAIAKLEAERKLLLTERALRA